MDDERWEPGMPVLDRQAIGRVSPPTRGSATRADRRPARESVQPPSLRGAPPRSVPETRPTPLQRNYVLLSVIPLVCGALAISALELGASPHDPFVRLCVIVGAPILLVVNADATLRIWRSAWAWMPVDRGKGLFRLAWVLTAAILLFALVAASILVLGA